MKKDRIKWQSLVDQARTEPIPSLDVRQQVTHRITQTTTLSLADWPTWTASALSVAAALFMMITVSQFGISLNDPLGDWFSSMFLVM